MTSVSLKSPAKLNLYLKVIRKRDDGYHELITLFERIDLVDDLRFSLNKSGKIRIFCKNPEVPKGSRNLIYKAANLLKEEFAIANGVDVYLHKRIPVAAGLAGGSSNAAIALVGLNRLWKLSLTKRQLLHYGRTLGSDVPFFLYDCSWAIGFARGDVIKPLNFTKKLTHILVVPRLKVYSSQVFRAFKLQLTKKNDNVNILVRALRKKDISIVSSLLSNDLEKTIVCLYPRLSRMKERLQNMFKNEAVFSGSGPSIYSIPFSLEKAKSMQKQLKKCYKQVFVVKTF